VWITSIGVPEETAIEGLPYHRQVYAENSGLDTPLYYSLETAPAGMVVYGDGLIEWERRFQRTRVSTSCACWSQPPRARWMNAAPPRPSRSP
jgi:hypothetical protein